MRRVSATLMAEFYRKRPTPHPRAARGLEGAAKSPRPRQVGAGELGLSAFASLLAGEAPRSGRGLPAALPAQWTAPPSGLFLERVLYPGDPPLPPLAPAVPVPAEPGL